MRSRRFWVLFYVGVFLLMSQVARGQSSVPISQLADPLWQMLLKSTTDLPQQIDSLTISLQTQISSLQTNNEQLQSSNEQLTASNRLLQQQNKDLQNSLKASEVALAISEQMRSQLGIQLDASLQSITQAQADAKALSLQIGLLKVGLYVAVPVAVAAVGYIGGHALKWW